MQIDLKLEVRREIMKGAHLWAAWLASPQSGDDAPDRQPWVQWRTDALKTYGDFSNVEVMAMEIGSELRAVLRAASV